MFGGDPKLRARAAAELAKRIGDALKEYAANADPAVRVMEMDYMTTVRHGGGRVEAGCGAKVWTGSKEWLALSVCARH